ncbi:S9 family peptidase [Sphingomonas sp.]|uniref:S9 family peptidase n=1 Tax=Sphingomonas sp. TaxID=28214 RepID=UPI002DBCB5E2|nr:S9 family peptidase [Sphingomonas sp.]HEU4968621.1 S9 family peptidase [Sphingomonas sp.]
MIARLLLAGAAMVALVAADAPQDAAAKFGALESVRDMSISPDGSKIAFVGPADGVKTTLYTIDLATGTPQLALVADGKPLRITGCDWVSNERLVCTIYAAQVTSGYFTSLSKLVGVDADGKNQKYVTERQDDSAFYVAAYGGDIIDRLPEEDGAVLITQQFVPEQKVGSLIAKRGEGLGVVRIDTRSGRRQTIEPPRPDAAEYITDGHGTVRIMGVQRQTAQGYAKSQLAYYYRKPDDRDWKPLGSYDFLTRDGFNPYAVDREKNVVYGKKRLDGRLALYAIALDGSMKETLVYSRPDVDVGGLVRVGRDQHVVGVNYAGERTETAYFDPTIETMASALAKAVPNMPIVDVIDSSTDGNKMILWLGADTHPGEYFLYDRSAKRLAKLMLDRPQLEGVTLASVKPIRYRASDGTMVPGYLTLPPASSGKNLPAIVMPHGGPEAHDEWGFDWLAQYYANRGYAVLQPNYRGSTGYGDSWFQKNGYKSWRSAIGDVVDAGRWLVQQGIADPKKLGIVGWSYGGYAALQANVVDPDLFKAVVAIAPVTDFKAMVSATYLYGDYAIERERFGSGPHLVEGSPAQNAGAFKAPVLMFHGDQDFNVGIEQSRMMDARLTDAGKKHQLVVFPGLDHQLADADARTQMLQQSDAFLRANLGIQ